jgi:hypothetical protein
VRTGSTEFSLFRECPLVRNDAMRSIVLALSGLLCAASAQAITIDFDVKCLHSKEASN